MISSYAEFGSTVAERCNANPDALFLTQLETGEDLTYRNFSKAYRAINFDTFGLKEGDFALFCVDNKLLDVVMLFSLLTSGIKPVLLSKSTKHQEIDAIGQILGARHLLSGNQGEIRCEQITSGRAPLILDRCSEVAYLVFTSGSSGAPKGIEITYDNILVETSSMTRAYGLTGADTNLCILPIYHASGLYRNLIMPFFLGAHTILVSNFKQEEFWAIIQQFQVGFTQVTPTIINGLLDEFTQNYTRPEKLKFIGSASAPHPDALVQKFESTFQVDLAVGYGMTEATCGITLNNVFPRQNYSVGKPIDCMKLEIIEEGLTLAAGDKGEVVISGPNIMAGYLNQGQNEKIRLKAKKLYTGDIGYLDDNGYLYLVGRENDIVKRGDYRLNLLEVEKEITALDFIKEACVIDVPHKFLGSDIIAFVVLGKGKQYRSQEILKFLKVRLDGMKMPSEVLPLIQLPKFDQLKVNKRELKRIYRDIKANRKNRIT